MSAPTNVQQALADLKRARAWALKHFNAGAEKDGLLDPPTFEVIFEEDKMFVYARSYGRCILPPISYRLAWVKGNVVWETHTGLGLVRTILLRIPEELDVPA